MVSGVTSFVSPIRVTTRDRRSTERYASFCRTLASRSGSISSRAVARRIVPSRWTVPAVSTSPRGSVKAYSVFIVLRLRPRQPLVADLDLLEGHLVRRRIEGPAAVLDRPARQELV